MTSTTRRVLATLVLTYAPNLSAETPRSLEEADRDILNRISRYHRASRALRVDGNPREWSALPSIAQPTPQAGVPSELQVLRVGVVPLMSGLYVMVATRRPLPNFNGSYWLILDVVGEDRFDFAVGVSSSRASTSNDPVTERRITR